METDGGSDKSIARCGKAEKISFSAGRRLSAALPRFCSWGLGIGIPNKTHPFSLEVNISLVSLL